MKAPALKWPNKVPTLTTKRLTLTEIRLSQASDYFLLVRDKATMAQFGVRPYRTLKETKALIRYLKDCHRKRVMIRWAIMDKESDLLIGDIGFWRFEFPRLRAEIGFKIRPECAGKGLMTEATEAIYDFGFKKMKLNSIEGNVGRDNPASAHLFKKHGFRRIGVIPKHSYSIKRKRFEDSVLYNLTASDWL